MHTFFGRGGSAGTIFHGERSFQGLNFSEEILHYGNLPEFLYEILLVSYFLIADSILSAEMLRVIVRGKFSPGFNCLENKSVWRRDLSLKV